MPYVFDNNILIYQLSDTLSAQGAELLRTGLLHGGAYSVISRIEIMGYPQSLRSWPKQISCCTVCGKTR